MMLLVENLREFERNLPGFLPPILSAADREVGASPGGAFRAALWAALAPGAGPVAVSRLHPVFDHSDFWSEFHLVSQARSSQYDDLRRVVSELQDLPGNVVCLALRGDGFHGQHGRKWAALAGNLHLCVGLRFDLDAQGTGMALTMLPAVAAVDALRRLYGPEPGPGGLGIKWVNDILCGKGKVGGVLSSVRSQNGRIRSAVLGIGLNVAKVPDISPTPFTPRVTSLKDHCRLPGIGLTTVLTQVLTALAQRSRQLEREGPGPLFRDYRSFSLVLGRECEIWPEGPAEKPDRRGRVLDIGTDLALTLSDGPEPVSVGRLVLGPLPG